MRITCPAIAAAALTSATLGDITITYTDDEHYSVVIDGMPDFDQVRVGLEQNGVGHCVPTVLTDFAAYAAAHGYPTLSPGAQSWTYWQQQSQFQPITFVINTLGGMLGTDPATGGTGYYGLTGGFHDWFPSQDFALMGSQTIDDTQVLFEDLRDHMLAGHLVMACTTFFSEEDGVLSPGGGHARALTEVSDDGITHRLAWRDPADGGDITTQSQFLTRNYELEREAVNVDGEWFVMDRMVGGGAHEYLTCYWVVVPVCGLTNDTGFNRLLIRKNISFIDEPQTEVLQMPGPGPVIHAAMHPSQPQFAILQQAAGFQQLWSYDCVTGTFIDVLSFEAAVGITYGRHGDLYTINGNSLEWTVGVGPGGGSFDLEAWADAIDYDDRTDHVVVLSNETDELIYVERDLSGMFTVDVPAEIVLGDEPLFALAPARPDAFAAWVATRGEFNVWRWEVDAKGAISVFTVPAGGPIDGISVGNDGSLHVSREGQLRVFDYVAGLGWAEDEGAPFAGTPAGSFFASTCSRSNTDPSVVGPWWDHIVPTEFGNGVPDCPGDIVVDAVVDASDLLALLGAWGMPGPLDLNGDGFVGTADMLILLGNWGPCD